MSDDRVRDALVWLEFASDDLAACRSQPGRHFRPRHVGNLAQQAADKAIKGRHRAFGPHTAEVARPGAAPRLAAYGWRTKRYPPDLERLSAYGVRARYPDDAIAVTPLESAIAVRQAGAVMQSVIRDFERQGVDLR